MLITTGTTYDYVVSVQDVTDFSGMQTEFSYDPNHFEAVTLASQGHEPLLETGVIPGTEVNITSFNQQTGKVTLTSGQFIAAGNAWSGVLTIVKLKAKTTGDVPEPTFVRIGASGVATPTANPAPGEYTNTQNVTLSCATSGATIRYTTNNIEPTSASLQYTGPIAVSANTTIKAKAFKTGMTDSNTASFTYTIKVATPTANPTPGTYTGTQNVTLSCATLGATIRYTTNGTEPTASSTQYSGPITVSVTTTIKAKAFKDGMAASATASFTYTINSQSTLGVPDPYMLDNYYDFRAAKLIVCLEWDDVPGATQYDVLVIDENGDEEMITVDSAFAEARCALGLYNYIYVRAKNANGTGDWCTPIEIADYFR